MGEHYKGALGAPRQCKRNSCQSENRGIIHNNGRFVAGQWRLLRLPPRTCTVERGHPIHQIWSPRRTDANLGFGLPTNAEAFV